MWCGIDPGLKGHVAFVDGTGYFELYKTPLIGKEYDIHAMRKLLSIHPLDGIAYEQVSAMPGQGVKSMFTFGKGFGIWLVLIELERVRYVLIHPAKWTRVMSRGAAGATAKEKSFHEARRRFPTWDPQTKVAREAADALLLAEYARLEFARPRSEEYYL